MAKLEQKYESVVVLSVKQGEEPVKAIIEKVTALISESAQLEGVDEWGKRRLAYAINYETDGYYVLFNFTSKPDFPAELDRVLNITDGVLRFLTVARNA